MSPKILRGHQPTFVEHDGGPRSVRALELSRQVTPCLYPQGVYMPEDEHRCGYANINNHPPCSDA